MDILKANHFALRFLLKISVLISLGYWGYTTGKGMLSCLFLSMGIPLLVMIIWGTFGSPAAAYKFGTIDRLFLEVVIFGCATIALFFASKSSIAVIFIVILLINKILLLLFRQ